jgi:hypothetical protein
MRVLRMDSMPLVIYDEGLKWVPYRDYPAGGTGDASGFQRRRKVAPSR